MFTPSDVIKKLQSTQSRLEKEAIVTDAWNSGCEEFFQGALLACDPLVTFGIKQVPEQTEVVSRNSLFSMEVEHGSFFELAQALIDRDLTGHTARDAIIAFMGGADTDMWNLFYRLVLLKDLKAGLTGTTINKVLRKIGTDEASKYLIPEFPYQRCSLPKDAKLEEWSWDLGVMSQLKADGMFANVNHTADGRVGILSRSGKAFPLEEFENIVINVKETFKRNTQSHGELLVYRDGKELPREIGNGILNHVAKGGTFEHGDSPVYMIWDQIPMESVVSKGKCAIQCKDRFADISTQVNAAINNSVILIENRIVHSIEEAYIHYHEMLALGFEGTIVKEPTCHWKDGKNKFHVKLKQEADVELEIIGFKPGKIGTITESTFGSIRCQSSDGLLEVSVSGFILIPQPGKLTRQQIWDMKDELIGTIMTVRSNGVMKPTSSNNLSSLFLPRFVEFRKDKTVANTLQEVKDQYAATIKV